MTSNLNIKNLYYSEKDVGKTIKSYNYFNNIYYIILKTGLRNIIAGSLY